MRKVAPIAGVLAVMLGLIAFAPQPAMAAPHSNPLIIPVTAPGGAFNGTFTLSSFAMQNGQLVANGILSGVDSNGVSHLATVTTPVSKSSTSTASPAAAAAAACPILHLTLGPIDLNLLGLSVTTNQIVLDITAIPGAGNLLGNLLCDVAGLLNTSPTTALVNLLNQVVTILQGL
jgi:hypothetical protein